MTEMTFSLALTHCRYTRVAPETLQLPVSRISAKKSTEFCLAANNLGINVGGGGAVARNILMNTQPFF